MSRNSSTRRLLRIGAVFTGIGLLVWLILRTGTATVVEHAKAVGWGMVLILLLGGVSHLLRTYAWRLTFRSDIRQTSVANTFALRLISEAIGNFGLAGQVVGDTARISLLGPRIPIADRISSVALDRGIYTLTAGIVSVTGIVAALVLLPVAGAWRIYALVFASVVGAIVLLTVVSFGRGWRFLSGAMRAIGRVPGVRGRLAGKLSVIESIEQNLLTFHSTAPRAFWGATILYVASQLLAVAEVYLLLVFMGARITFFGALVIEAFTKLISVVGAVNPGNVGTYEGGNLLLARLLRLTPAAGLTLALCRRARTLFWAGIGALCLSVLSRREEPKMREPTEEEESGSASETKPAWGVDANEQARRGATAVIVVVDSSEGVGGFIPALATIGGLPVLLRAILSAQMLEPSRVVVSVPAGSSGMKDALLRTRRLPEKLDWLERSSGAELCELVRELARAADRVVLISGSNLYKPALLSAAGDWNEPTGALVFRTVREPIGLCCVSKAAGVQLPEHRKVGSAEELQDWIETKYDVAVAHAPAEQWQRLVSAENLVAAEHKMDGWLVKPTDGIFARFNRRISIPISRQLIKTPITPNGVTFLVLAVSVAAAVFFARGGYWNMLTGALLSVWASILDGCDGEVARFKLQSSKLGCWLDTICDYLYYLMTFAGITWGLNKSSGSNVYLVLGAALVIGAMLSFFIVSFMRRRVAADDPGKFLARFHNQAESRSTNPLVFVARHCEFIIRRCFFPYALLVATLLNITKPIFMMTAVGANLVWIIALYSSFALRNKNSAGCVPFGLQLNAGD